MVSAGIDIGSRTIELVVLKDNEIVEKRQRDSGFDPMTQGFAKFTEEAEGTAILGMEEVIRG